MPPRKYGIARFSRELTYGEEWELLLGEGGRTSHFLSDADRKNAWFFHRERLLEMSPPGKRPWAWWAYEAREHRPIGGEQTLRLLEMSVIGDAEMRRLESWPGLILPAPR
jgi:hypothetical protein